MFSPFGQALDLTKQLAWGRLLCSPLDLGVWSLLEPMGIQNHAPQLCWIRPDLLGCVWMAGGGEGTAGMSVMLSLLAAHSGQWTPPQLISQDDQRSEQNPLVFVSEQHLHLIHSAQRVRDPQDGSWNQAGSTFSMQWTAALRHQRLELDSLQIDQPKTWAAAAWSPATDLLEEPSFCRHPPLKQANGNWLLPIYRSLETGGSFGHDYSELLTLQPDAQPQGLPTAVPNSTGRVHGSLVPARDGKTLLQFFRSRLADYIYRSISNDQGISWSSPEPIKLPSNNSSIQAARLASGRLAMIYNRFNFSPDPKAHQPWGEANWPRTRWPLSIALSEDDGDSWPWIRDIDTGWGFQGTSNWTHNGQLAYPTLVEGRPQELHVAYSWAGREAIRYVCVREEDILGDQLQLGWNS